MSRKARHRIEAVRREFVDTAWLEVVESVTEHSFIGSQFRPWHRTHDGTQAIPIVDQHIVPPEHTVSARRRQRICQYAGMQLAPVVVQPVGVTYSGIEGFVAVNLVVTSDELSQQRRELNQLLHIPSTPLSDSPFFTVNAIGFATGQLNRAAFNTAVIDELASQDLLVNTMTVMSHKVYAASQ